jgi:hypothetical protein
MVEILLFFNGDLKVSCVRKAQNYEKPQNRRLAATGADS